MRRLSICLLFFVFVAFSASAQDPASDDEFVLVHSDGKDELVSVNNLVGYWYNKAAQGTFNAIMSRNEPKYFWLKQGQTISVKDDWIKDYATGFENARWHVVGNQLYLYQPEIGLKPISIERVGKSKNYLLRVNNVEYSRKVNLTGVASIRD